MRTIKKYANRKLYDTEGKHYISLEQLAELVKEGEEVSIIDNTTGEDITSSVLSQLLARDQKDKEGLPSSVLADLLRKGGGTLSDYAKKYAHLWKNAMNMAEEEVDKLVRRLVKDKELSAAEGSRLRKEISGYIDSSRKWISEQVDQRVSDVVGAMKLATRDQVKDLSKKIDALTRKIEEMEKGSAAPHEPPDEDKG